MSDLTEDAQQRYDQIRRVVAAALAVWRENDGLSIQQMSDQTGIIRERIEAALLADWDPSLRDLAKIEAASGMTLLVTLRNQDKDHE